MPISDSARPVNIAISIPVDIVLENRTIQGAGWSVPQWDVPAVLSRSQEHSGPTIPQVVHKGEGLYLWRGFRLNLYRDSAECYRHNLSSNHPSLFVICHEAEDGIMQPLIVTADGLEASAANEGDDRVCRVDIAPDIYLTIERFIVEHCVAKPRKKRRRENWSKRPPQ